MRFAFVEEQRDIPVNRLCVIADVSLRGNRAWRPRPASRRQRTDMVLLAHIREQFRLPLGSYSRPLTKLLETGYSDTASVPQVRPGYNLITKKAVPMRRLLFSTYVRNNNSGLVGGQLRPV